jgi:hypothetical protein
VVNETSTTLYAQQMSTLPYKNWDVEAASKVIVSDYELDSDEIVKLIEEELL